MVEHQTRIVIVVKWYDDDNIRCEFGRMVAMQREHIAVHQHMNCLPVAWSFGLSSIVLVLFYCALHAAERQSSRPARAKMRFTSVATSAGGQRISGQ